MVEEWWRRGGCEGGEMHHRRGLEEVVVEGEDDGRHLDWKKMGIGRGDIRLKRSYTTLKLKGRYTHQF